MLNKVAIIGVGLIGGSFALALKQAGAVRHVVGIGRKPETLLRAQELGIIDEAIANTPEQLAVALADCDLVLLAAPVAQTAQILAMIAPHLGAQTLVTDAGSTKSDVIAAARMTLGPAIGRFIPGHPISGREMNGPDAALADLYVGKRVILTPLHENRVEDLARVRLAWEACSAIVSEMPAHRHDAVLASVSHLPHVLAYALVAQIALSEDADVKFGLGGGGFRDFTRIAASSPEMWRDIVIANRSALLTELDGYCAMLAQMRDLIDSSDGPGLEALFALARLRRINWPHVHNTAAFHGNTALPANAEA